MMIHGTEAGLPGRGGYDMKRLTCLVLLLLLLAPAGAMAEVRDVANWYEVFVRSYQDSDGDGIGDLKGLMRRLDYIEDMGWRGLWLMPLMPSPSYHKYDVTDYLSVDPEYGTMEDLRALVAACHARGMRIILDLPVNHTSTEHPWFRAACAALRRGETGDSHVGYYNFSREPGSGFASLPGTDWYYEEQFAGGNMPDLNLDNPAVWAELRAIFDFWLGDVGVDGFRLDAVTSYFTGDTARNVECLRALKAMAEEIQPGSILIGECWAGLSTIAEYYESGVDSFFLFPAAQAEGFVARAVLARSGGAEKYAKGWQAALDAVPAGCWLTPFLCNHDTGRAVGLVQGRSNPAAAKFAEGALGMLGGGVFTYYGEEIGMAGSGDDPNKRLAMYWSDGDMTDQPPSATGVEYAYPSVDKQREDPASILNYVRAVNRARLDYPAISTGANETLLAEGDLCLMRRSGEDGEYMIAMNFSAKESRTMEVPDSTIAVDLEVGDGSAVLKERGESPALTLPPRAIAVLVPVQ